MLGGGGGRAFAGGFAFASASASDGFLASFNRILQAGALFVEDDPALLGDFFGFGAGFGSQLFGLDTSLGGRTLGTGAGIGGQFFALGAEFDTLLANLFASFSAGLGSEDEGNGCTNQTADEKTSEERANVAIVIFCHCDSPFYLSIRNVLADLTE